METAAFPDCPSGQRTLPFIHCRINQWRTQHHELRRQLSALLCCELLPLPEVEHATLRATFNHTLAAYLATGSQVLRRVWQQCHRQRDPVRRKLLLHLLTHIEESTSRVLACSAHCTGNDHNKASFYTALAGCCRQLQLRFVLEEQLLEVLQEYPPPERRKYRKLPRI
jgi:regulator of sigma D